MSHPSISAEAPASASVHIAVVHPRPLTADPVAAIPPSDEAAAVKQRAAREGHQWLPYGPPIRGIAIIAILIGHSFDMAMFDSSLSYGWRCVAISFDSLFRWAVPAFIMLSGAILAVPRPGKSVLGFYKKRLGRIGLPIVFWSAFFMCFDVEVLGWTKSWGDSLHNLAMGKPYNHMFFIFRFVGLYTLAPAIQWLNAHVSRRPFAALTIGLFIAVAIDSYIMQTNSAERGAIIGTFYFLPYFMAGYLLRTAYLSRRGIAIALLAWALATAALILSTVFAVDPWSPSMSAPSAAFAMWDHVSPLRIVIGISMWLVLITVLKGPKLERPFFKIMADVIAPAAFGLYLIHPLFRDGLHALGLTATYPALWIGIPVSVTCIITWTIGLTLGIMKVPYLRKIVA